MNYYDWLLVGFLASGAILCISLGIKMFRDIRYREVQTENTIDITAKIDELEREIKSIWQHLAEKDSQ